MRSATAGVEPFIRYITIKCEAVKRLFVDEIKGKKASHTRYRALGLELIPVYRQSASR